MRMAKTFGKMRMRRNRKAELGISTMIIFIAMVLVAAVAATLLISMAYEIQQQAQETGRVALQDVSTGFRVIGMVGDRTENGTGATPYTSNIEVLEIKVALDSGSPRINMSQVIIEVTDGTVEATLNYSSAPNASTLADPASEYAVEMLRDPDHQYTSDAPLASSGSILKIYINAAMIGMNLSTQAQVDMRIIPKHGVPTYEYFETPAIYVNRYIQLT
jgi:flagellin FlaB